MTRETALQYLKALYCPHADFDVNWCADCQEELAALIIAEPSMTDVRDTALQTLVARWRARAKGLSTVAWFYAAEELAALLVGEPRQEENEDHPRVVGVPVLESSMGSTAAINQPIRASVENEDELDPGIRDVVARLQVAGFETTDSGDGVSKADMACAMDCPNVAAKTTAATMTTDAERMVALLGDGWTVQASYSTDDKHCLLLATKAR